MIKKASIKRVLNLCLMSIVLFILAGCTTQNYSVAINEDNTVSFTTKVSMKNNTLNQLQELQLDSNVFSESPTDIFQPVTEVYEQRGFQATNVTDNVAMGMEYSKTYDNISMFNNEMKDLVKEDVSGLDIEIRDESTLLNNVYTVAGNVSYLLPDGLAEYSTEFPEWVNYTPTQDMVATVYINSKLGSVSGVRDGEMNGNQAYWSTNFEESAEPLDEQSPLPVGVQYTLQRPIVRITIFFLVGLVVIGLGLYIVRRKQLKDKDGEKK